jgi:hypothetical protein
MGWKSLQDSVSHFGENGEYTKLNPDLRGVDPDDGIRISLDSARV